MKFYQFFPALAKNGRVCCENLRTKETILWKVITESFLIRKAEKLLQMHSSFTTLKVLLKLNVRIVDYLLTTH